MPDFKISALPAVTAPAETLELAVNEAGVSKKVTAAQLKGLGPVAHAASHQNGSVDEVSVGGLSGLLADAQTPLGHSHAIGDTAGLQAALDAKADTTHTHAAADITSGQLAMARIASGTPDGTRFVRDDGVLAVPAGGGGGLSYQEADRATDLALSTTFQAAVSLSLAAGTWLVLGQSSIESTSTTQGNCNVRLRDTTNSVTYAIAECEVDSALPDRASLFVHAVIVLAATATIALEGRQSAGTSHMIGPGNLSDTATKVTRMTAVKIA